MATKGLTMGRSLAARPALAVLMAACLAFEGCATSFQGLQTGPAGRQPNSLATRIATLEPDQLVRITTTAEDEFRAKFVALESDQLYLRDKSHWRGNPSAPDRKRLVYGLLEIREIEVATGRRVSVLAVVSIALFALVGLASELNMGS